MEKKQIYTFIFSAIVVILFGVFIYPTLYKYDKLDQRYPVKINRVTGSAQILTQRGWIDTTGYNAAAREMETYKNEIKADLGNIQDAVRNEVVQGLKEEIISEIKTELESVKAEIEVYKQFETDPDNYFTIGSSKEEVRSIMGVPSSFNKYDYTNEEVWYYGSSSITFSGNKVKEYNNPTKNLRVR